MSRRPGVLMRAPRRIDRRLDERIDRELGGEPIGKPLTEVGHVVLLREAAEFGPYGRAGHGSESHARFAHVSLLFPPPVRVSVSDAAGIEGVGRAHPVEARSAVDRFAARRRRRRRSGFVVPARRRGSNAETETAADAAAASRAGRGDERVRGPPSGGPARRREERREEGRRDGYSHGWAGFFLFFSPSQEDTIISLLLRLLRRFAVLRAVVNFLKSKI
mmetsp:Transcript_19383/g.56694  ORF Transcript_19383/g.56694 Transcript_19383/m.56694 type:complete len:219 (-) Transcript_19383:188-844(-)